jgi:hypothetical protein
MQQVQSMRPAHEAVVRIMKLIISQHSMCLAREAELETPS